MTRHLVGHFGKKKSPTYFALVRDSVVALFSGFILINGCDIVRTSAAGKKNFASDTDQCLQ